MARQRGVVFERLDGRVNRSASVVAKYHDQGRTQDGNCIFHAGNRIVIGEVTRHAADEQVASGAIKGIFGRDARIGATQNAGVGILPPNQRFPFTLEVMTPGNSVDVQLVAFHQ